MALQGPIPVQFSQVFPHGAYAAGVIEPVRDFDASKDGRFVQAKDRDSGLPVWAVDVIDADPAARSMSATWCCPVSGMRYGMPTPSARTLPALSADTS